MTRLLRHLLLQQSFYPLYPSPPDFNLELEQTSHVVLPVLPQVLICPSDLRYFIKTVEGVLCVNPGRLARGQSGGSFGRIQVDLKNRKHASVADVSKAEIVKI